MMTRLVIKAYLIFLWLLCVADIVFTGMFWDDLMTGIVLQERLFEAFCVIPASFVLPYIFFYWKRINPGKEQPRIVRRIWAYCKGRMNSGGIVSDFYKVIGFLLFLCAAFWAVCFFVGSAVYILWHITVTFLILIMTWPS